jgi:hypothetical protein
LFNRGEDREAGPLIGLPLCGDEIVSGTVVLEDFFDPNHDDRFALLACAETT